MSNIVVTLDSHALTHFQTCRRLYKHSDVEQLELRRRHENRNLALDRGTYMHELIQWMFKALQKGYSRKDAISLARRWMRRKQEVPADEELFLQTRFLEYCQHYETDNWKIKGVEVGFSRVLYHSKNLTYIYEGKIDLIVEISGRRMWIDHKTQSRKYDLYKNRNQFFGYTWALGARNGMVNYVGLQQKVTKDTFRRVPFSYRKDEIEDWRRNTVQWFDEVLWANANNTYQKNRASCETKYGICPFHHLCDQTDPRVIKSFLEEKYVKSERKWKAW